jgi:hypothetical protein
VRLEGLGKLENPMTASGIEPANLDIHQRANRKQDEIRHAAVPKQIL